MDDISTIKTGDPVQFGSNLAKVIAESPGFWTIQVEGWPNPTIVNKKTGYEKGAKGKRARWEQLSRIAVLTQDFLNRHNRTQKIRKFKDLFSKVQRMRPGDVLVNRMDQVGDLLMRIIEIVESKP